MLSIYETNFQSLFDKKKVFCIMKSWKFISFCCQAQYQRLLLETFNSGMLICFYISNPPLLFVNLITFNLLQKKSCWLLINSVKIWIHIFINGIPAKDENSKNFWNEEKFKVLKQRTRTKSLSHAHVLICFEIRIPGSVNRPE